MIKIKNLKKSFGDLEVLSDINLEIQDGEIYGLVGKSGAGKSTLLRCINKLEEYDDGTIEVNNVDIRTLNKKSVRLFQKNISMIFQHFPLLSRKTVYENIIFPMKCWKYPKSEMDAKVKYLADIVGITDKLDQKPATLSGGQKQRVAIARALSMDPKILLCDEATSALDPGTTKQILALLRKINEELGITIVVVTHQMNVVRQICQRVSLLENGRIVLSGPVEDLFIDQPDALRRFLADDNEERYPNGVNIKIMMTDDDASRQIFYKMTKDIDATYTVCAGNTETYRDKQLGSIVININKDDEQRICSYLTEQNVVFHKCV